jgi:hypothetical protein
MDRLSREPWLNASHTGSCPSSAAPALRPIRISPLWAITSVMNGIEIAVGDHGDPIAHGFPGRSAAAAQPQWRARYIVEFAILSAPDSDYRLYGLFKEHLQNMQLSNCTDREFCAHDEHFVRAQGMLAETPLLVRPERGTALQRAFKTRSHEKARSAIMTRVGRPP